MSTVVLDIETVPIPWLDLDPLLREKLTRRAEDPEDYQRRKKGGALSPYTGRTIVIGLLNPDSRRGKLWFEEAGGPSRTQSDDRMFELVGCDERTMLEECWATLKNYDRVVTFNGRGFDGPFLAVRSAVHGLRPSKNLAGYRYSLTDHVDLVEVLTFQGAVAWDQRPSLHAACVAFGIPSPKTAEVHGYAVEDMYRQGRVREIADYCRRDVEATAELYRRLEPTMLPLFRRE